MAPEATSAALDAPFRAPAFVTAHSHAFQRALRGAAQRPTAGQPDDFWGWRQAMYHLASSLTPESLYRASLVAYRELARGGVSTVGEFHYLHHQPGGAPYDDRTVMSDAVVRAAKDAGLRIALLRVVYARGGPNRDAEGAQLRFRDGTPDQALADVETLLGRYAGDPDVRVGIAPHSVRALSADWLRAIASFTEARPLPVHMHVAEQPAEVASCLAESHLRPVELLREVGLLSRRFVAVHATHIAPHEARLLGESGSWVCLCPTTERDLADGLPDVAELVERGVGLCLGVDSHVLSDPFEEMRGVVLGERLRTGKRFGPWPVPAARIWRAASDDGARSLGFADAGAFIEIRRDAPAMELVPSDRWLDALVFSGSAAIVERVVRTGGSGFPGGADMLEAWRDGS